MNPAELSRRLRDLEDAVSTLRADAEHDARWESAVAEVDTPRPNFSNLISETEHEAAAPEVQKALRDLAMHRTETGGFVSPDYEAKCVEQIELFIHDQSQKYHVRFRFDDDSTEKLGIFETYEVAYDYARKQARRYHIPIFDTTYEDLVD